MATDPLKDELVDAKPLPAVETVAAKESPSIVEDLPASPVAQNPEDRTISQRVHTYMEGAGYGALVPVAIAIAVVSALVYLAIKAKTKP
jgi:hypothetical protein